MVQVPRVSSHTVYVLGSKHIHRVPQFYILQKKEREGERERERESKVFLLQARCGPEGG